MFSVYKILFIWKEWKRMLGLVNIEPPRLQTVSSEEDQRNCGMILTK